ncbi:hypothetical protein ACYZX9_11385 [Sphingomonas citri]
MYDANAIERAVGAEALVYAQNKNRGGRSSAKGRDFELVYGAFRVALAAAEAHRAGQTGDDVSFVDQVLCFVDDFVMSRPAGLKLEQLKSGGASWMTGDHHLADDFRYQKRLDQAEGLTASYRLVVGDDGLQHALLGGRPDDLDDVEVISFPGLLPDVQLIARLPELSEALAEMSPRPSEQIVREQVWRMLLGTWAGSRGEQTLAALVNEAAAGPGGVVAPLREEYVLPNEAKIILDNVPGLRFYIRKNFFAYEAFGGTQRGVADFHCYTPQFEAFVTNLMAHRPTDFFEFWTVFKAHV